MEKLKNVLNCVTFQSCISHIIENSLFGGVTYTIGSVIFPFSSIILSLVILLSSSHVIFSVINEMFSSAKNPLFFQISDISIVNIFSFCGGGWSRTTVITTANRKIGYMFYLSVLFTVNPSD